MLRFVLFGIASITASADDYDWESYGSGWGSGGRIKVGYDRTHQGAAMVYAVPHSNALHAVNSDGTANWTFNADGAVFNSILDFSAPSGNTWFHGGTIFVSGNLKNPDGPPHSDGNVSLVALSGSDGSILWQHTSQQPSRNFDGGVEFTVEKSFVDRYVTCYLIIVSKLDHSRVVEAIDAYGKLKWSWNYPSVGSLHFDPDKGMLVQRMDGLASLDIQSLSLVDGSEKWTLPLPSANYTFFQNSADIMTFAEDGSIFVVQDQDTKVENSIHKLSLLRLNADDGRILWNISVLSMVETSTLATPHHNQFFFLGSMDSVYVNGLLGEDGETCNLRVFNFAGEVQRNLPCLNYGRNATDLVSTPHSVFTAHSESDTFFITNENIDTLTEASIFAYSGADGTLLWNVSIDGLEPMDPSFIPYATYPPDFLELRALYSNNTLFAKQDRHLYCFSNGTEAWKVRIAVSHEPEKPVYSSMLPAVTMDGTAFVVVAATGKGVFATELIAFASDGVEKWRYPFDGTTLVV